ncbi:MAG: molybdenum cofactor guanylyltransferase [Candidatus Fermentibacteraceae bacterium]|nr:molybdenum cofactor guanylyltransferase [Candidatus Fermentibacteraceae bacterium]
MIFKDVSLLVLAGGESSRMGFPKYLLPASGGTVTDHIINRLGGMFTEVIVAGRGLELTRTDARVVEDVRMKRTPLVGILSGVLAAETPRVFVIGCDMPFVRKQLIRRLVIETDSDVVVPVVRGYHEPLCAVYSSSAAENIQRYLDAGGSKVTGFYSSVTVTEISEQEVRKADPFLESFINLNTPRDYEKWSSVWAE